jgi:hypothetical protein
VRQLSDAAIEELLEAVFSMRSVLRYCKVDKSRFQLVARYFPASKGVNTEAEEATALEAVTRRQPVKTQKTEKEYVL